MTIGNYAKIPAVSISKDDGDILASKPTGTMVVDIGGGTCDIAVISLNGIVVHDSLKVAGDEFDQAIARYIKKQYNMTIGDSMA